MLLEKIKFSISSKLHRRLLKWFDTDFYPIFICGTAGGGTTLLSSLIDQRYAISVNERESALGLPEHSELSFNPASSYDSIENYLSDMLVDVNIADEKVREELIALYQKKPIYPKASNWVLDKAPNTHLRRATILNRVFPEAKFVLVVRDPVANIEGWRRKWPLFAETSFSELCDAWELLFREFLRDTRDFSDQVYIVSFENLISNTDEFMERISKFLGLRRREAVNEYQDISNNPGKGLRNVDGGMIKIDKTSNQQAYDRLNESEITMIKERLMNFYEEIVALSTQFDTK